MGLQDRASQAVQLAFYRTFYRWGHFVARKPKCVIFTSLILAVLLSTRLLLSFSGKEQFELPQELEQDKLWVPQKAAAPR